MSKKKPAAAKPTNDNGPAEPVAPAAPIGPVVAIGIGTTLREARESTGQTVAQIAARLRIKPDYLQALEDDDSDGLPGRVYAIGFLRSYATYLDLDPMDMIRRFKGTAETAAESPELKVLKPTPQQRQTPGGPAIAISAVVVIAILAGWYYFSSASNPLNVRTVAVPESLSTPPAGSLLAPVARLVPELENHQELAQPEPVALVEPEVEPQPETESEPATEIAAVAPEAPEDSDTGPEITGAEITGAEITVAEITVAEVTGPEIANPQPSGELLTTPAEEQIAIAPDALPEPPAQTPVAETTAPRSFGQVNRGGRILLTAKSDIWIQVRDPEGADIFTRMLREGESYRVPNRPDLRLLTGNAGALAVTIDGNPAPPLGDFGTILRDHPLNPEGLQ